MMKMFRRNFGICKSAQLRFWFIFTSILLLIDLVSSRKKSTPYTIYYMEDYCSSSSREKGILYLKDSGPEIFESGIIIRPSKYSRLPRNFPADCTLHVWTQSAKKYNFIISFLFIDLKEGYFERCIDYLRVLSEDLPQPLCHVDYEKPEKVHTILYEKRSFSLILQARNSVELDGFELVVTLGQIGTNCTNNSDFKCQNGQCISKKFQCDWRNNCGDTSDELPSQCDPAQRSPSTPVIAFLVSIVIVIILIAVALAYYFRSRGGLAGVCIHIRMKLKVRENTRTLLEQNAPRRRAPPPPIVHIQPPRPTRPPNASVKNPAFLVKPRPPAPPPPPRRPRY